VHDYDIDEVSRQVNNVYMPPPRYNPHRPYEHLANTDLAKDTFSLQKIFIILSIGEIAPWENQIWIIQRFKELRDKLQKEIALDKNGVGLRLLIAQFSPESSTVRTRVGSYTSAVQALVKDDSDIEVVEYADNMDIMFHLADCVVLANTAKFMPLIAIEAMSRAVPLLLSEEFAAENLITKGKEGFYFNIAQSSLPPDLKLTSGTKHPAPNNHLLNLLTKMVQSQFLCDSLSRKARNRFDQKFSFDIMLDSYRNAFWFLCPPLVLVDMDNVIMDLDGGFMEAWRESFEERLPHGHDDTPSDDSVGGETLGEVSFSSSKSSGSDITFLVGEDDGVDKILGRTRVDSTETKQGEGPIRVSSATKVPFLLNKTLRESNKVYNLENMVDPNVDPKQRTKEQKKNCASTDIPVVYRAKSYHIQNCVEEKHRPLADEILHRQNFFLDLKLKEGALQGLQEMLNNGINVLLCSDNGTSEFAAQEKMSWIVTHLGRKWLDRFVLVEDKMFIQGEVLIETMARPCTHLSSSWRSVLFTMPFNMHATVTIPRINHWHAWSEVILGIFNKSPVPGSITWSRRAAEFSALGPQIVKTSTKNSEKGLNVPNAAPLLNPETLSYPPLSTHAHNGTEKCEEISNAESKWDSFAKVLGNSARRLDAAAAAAATHAAAGKELPADASGAMAHASSSLKLKSADDKASPSSTCSSDHDPTENSTPSALDTSDDNCDTPYEADTEDARPRSDPSRKRAKRLAAVEPVKAAGESEASAAAAGAGAGAGAVGVTGELAPEPSPSRLDNAYGGADLTSDAD